MEEKAIQDVPYIKRTIDGRTYTVMIHFKEDAKETAKDKMKRILKAEIRKECVD